MKFSDCKVIVFFSRVKVDCFFIDDKEMFFFVIDWSCMIYCLLMLIMYLLKEVDEFGIFCFLYKGVYIDVYFLYEYFLEVVGFDEDFLKNDR